MACRKKVKAGDLVWVAGERVKLKKRLSDVEGGWEVEPPIVDESGNRWRFWNEHVMTRAKPKKP